MQAISVFAENFKILICIATSATISKHEVHSMDELTIQIFPKLSIEASGVSSMELRVLEHPPQAQECLITTIVPKPVFLSY